MEGFREKTVSGVAWSVASQAGRQVAVFLSSVALARLLTPADFGLIAIAVVFSNFTFLLSEQGFSFALIQMKDAREEHLSSTFWMNMAVGAVLAAAFALAAPLAARAYSLPGLVPVMRTLAVTFAVFPLGMTHKVVMTRELEFRKIAAVEIGAAWAGGALAVVLAWKGAGVYSIAAQHVVETAIAAAAPWALCAWRPRALFLWTAIRELAGFSSRAFASSMANYWVRNVDNLLIGYFLGPVPLGLYSRAYAIMLFPMSRVTWVFSRVLVRSFSIIREEPARVRSLFLKVSRATALVVFPMMLGVVASADAFVAVVFGPQWGDMVPILRVLAIVGMVQAVISLVGSLFLSHDRLDAGLRVSLVVQTLEVAGIVAGLYWGALGVAIGYALASLAARPFYCLAGVRVIGLGGREFFGSLAGVLACSAAMAACAAAVGAALPRGLPATAVLGAQVAAGTAVYWALLHGLGVRGYREALDLARERLRAA